MNNFYPHLFVFWLVDYRNIYVTHFELLVFIVIYTYFTFVLASKDLTADYIKKVIET
jgi:hypothetical protein